MSIQIDQLLYTTIESHSNARDNLPAGFWIAFSVLNAVHTHYWFWIKKEKIWNKNNGIKLGFGAAIYFVAGSSKYLKIIAKITEVSLHVAKAIQAMDRIEKNGKKFYRLITNEEPINVKIKWRKDKSRLLNPAAMMSLHYFKLQEIKRIKLIGECVLSILSDLFLISMYTLDAKSAYYKDPLKDALQMTELVANISELSNQIEFDVIVKDLLDKFGYSGDYSMCLDHLKPVKPHDSPFKQHLVKFSKDFSQSFTQTITWLFKREVAPFTRKIPPLYICLQEGE